MSLDPEVVIDMMASKKQKHDQSIQEGDGDDIKKHARDHAREHAHSCRHKGCTNYVVNKGVCIGHGAKVKICKVEGCTTQAVRGGICVRHGAQVRISCSHEGCTK